MSDGINRTDRTDGDSKSKKSALSLSSSTTRFNSNVEFNSIEPLLLSAAQFIEPQNHPQFSKLAPQAIEEAIAESQADCPVAFWGGGIGSKPQDRFRRFRAVKALTAHKLKIRYSQFGVMAGEAVEAAKGGTPSLPATSPNEDDYMATSFGREFIRLRNQIPICGIVC